jgi:hypothetical protein
MKKNLFLLLVLVCFVTASFPATTGMPNRVIFGVTNGATIFVRDYEVLPNARWNFLRELQITAKGPVGTIAATRPNDNARFSILYTYQSGSDILGRQVGINYDTFQITSDKELGPIFGGYNLNYCRIQNDVPNRGRFSYIHNDRDFSSHKIRDGSDKVLKKPLDVIQNNDQDLVINTDVEWSCTYAGQIRLSLPTEKFFLDIREQNGAAKPVGSQITFGFTGGEVLNLGLGRFYDHLGFRSNVIATREHKLEGSTHKTSVNLALLDWDQKQTIKLGAVYRNKSYSSTQFQASIFNTLDLSDLYNSDEPEKSISILTYGIPVKGDFITRLRFFNPGTLAKIGKDQTIIGPGDPVLEMTGYGYGYYSTWYYDHDDIRKKE